MELVVVLVCFRFCLLPQPRALSPLYSSQQCTKALHDAQMHFHDRIAQLVYTFPEDAPTSTGALFWSAPKRFPRALDWSAADPSHVAFVQAAALLRAEVFGITPPAWAQDPAKVSLPLAGPAAVLLCSGTLLFLWLCLVDCSSLDATSPSLTCCMACSSSMFRVPESVLRML